MPYEEPTPFADVLMSAMSPVLSTTAASSEFKALQQGPGRSMQSGKTVCVEFEVPARTSSTNDSEEGLETQARW